MNFVTVYAGWLHIHGLFPSSLFQRSQIAEYHDCTWDRSCLGASRLELNVVRSFQSLFAAGTSQAGEHVKAWGVEGSSRCRRRIGCSSNNGLPWDEHAYPGLTLLSN